MSTSSATGNATSSTLLLVYHTPQFRMRMVETAMHRTTLLPAPFTKSIHSAIRTLYHLPFREVLLHHSNTICCVLRLFQSVVPRALSCSNTPQVLTTLVQMFIPNIRSRTASLEHSDAHHQYPDASWQNMFHGPIDLKETAKYPSFWVSSPRQRQRHTYSEESLLAVDLLRHRIQTAIRLLSRPP